MEYHLTTPLNKNDIIQLNAGDIVYLTGTVLTARDEAHARILEIEEKGEPLPFNLEGAVIYHCGPLMQQIDNKWHTVAAGPTTSGRMSKMTPPLLEKFNVRALIGKGGMQNVSESLKDKCVYLTYTGGCAALAAISIKNVSNVHWLDLGMPEAVWELDVVEFGPLVVGIDSNGCDLLSDVRENAKQAFSRI
ncbi:MAG: FumA C-terminus/TtdB family hydratase beta subunit [Methanosarcinaceae archaeon]|nr:FumA C-terminus/TtdB family hydratase beta subunit [Methanosarcinaceae archaeon]